MPDCAGKTCGPDGCGGSCGTCSGNATCNGTSCVCDATLQPGATLSIGDSVKSCDARFWLTMQADGNLVLYGPPGALWSSNTHGTGADRAAMQGDGNFVVYGGSTAYWNSNTANHPGAYLSVQDDGNMVIYDGTTSLWSTGTCCY